MSVIFANLHIAFLDETLGITVGTVLTSLITLLAGLLAGVATFNDALTKSESHFSISARYFDIATDIEAELVKPRAFRLAADVFITRTQHQIDAANARAPVIPLAVTKALEAEKAQGA